MARASASLKYNADIKQNLDANDAEQQMPELQATFLSESVRKYLELGRAIPGIIYFVMKFLYLVN